MADHDRDDFRLKPGPPRDRDGARTPGFIHRVLKASNRAGGSFGGRRGDTRARAGARAGRGHVAAQLAGRGLDHRARRVIVKTRLVNLRRAGARSVEKHLRYIERDGVTRDGGRGQLYGPDTDQADGRAFEERCREDRHQFRFIISADDALELGDLKTFVRTHMAQVQRDLGTKLDWVAVDHWDTDNPHTHLVLRGKDDRGADLVIARDYIAYGMRNRGAEIATRWLGRRSEREIAQGLEREVRAQRWTQLDQALLRGTHEGIVDLRAVPGELGRRRRRTVLVGRLQYLAELGLAEKRRGAQWALRPEAEQTLRSLGSRGDIVRTLQRSFGAM